MHTLRRFRPVLFAASLLTLGAVISLPASQHSETQSGQHKPAGVDSGHGDDTPEMERNSMPGMEMPQTIDGSDNPAERGAVMAMSHGAAPHGHHHQMGPHMYMTKLRPSTPEDWAKADTLAKEVREAIEPYKDYRRALADGYRIFLPNLPQQEYHFTNYWNAFLESFSFDPMRPTSLLYKKTKDGYELIGAMYTMPRRVSEEQLNERIPLSVAQWHLHTNLCMPPREQRAHADWNRFGLQGSITTKETCSQAGGTFYPVIFGWMVHVYPFEKSLQEVFAQ
jgi:hypothetical protein